jgi:epsilon-lactone hydrolase
MDKLSQYVPSATLICIAVLSTLSITSLTAHIENLPAPVDSDGTLHVSELTIPPSDFWSPEFKRGYAKFVGGISVLPKEPHPAKGAPKSDWDAFYAAQDSMLAETLAWDLQHYPVSVLDTEISGVHVGIISPKPGVAPENRRRILIDLHCCGFVDFRGLSFGQLESVPIASIGRIKVIAVDYRQAPFYKYPAATEDVEAVYRKLLEQYQPEAIGIFGCSSGGALVSQAVSRFQAKGLPRPGAIGIFCAAPPDGSGKEGDAKMWGLGMIPESHSMRTATTPGNASGWYMAGADPTDPQAYPASSDSVLSRFPPTLFLTGTRALDLSPAIVAHARLLKLGVDSYLYIMEGGWHAAHAGAVGTPEARDANAYVARWFEQHLAR